MKKQTIPYIITALTLVILGVSVTRAAWSEPSFPPVTVNRAAPVNSGRIHQIKDQGLGVQTFFVATNAQFDQAVFASGMIRGGSPATNPMTPSTVSFGDAIYTTNIEATGEISVKDTIQAVPLTNPAVRQLCADEQGYIRSCL
jgi:hypothetical protein